MSNGIAAMGGLTSAGSIVNGLTQASTGQSANGASEQQVAEEGFTQMLGMMILDQANELLQGDPLFPDPIDASLG